MSKTLKLETGTVPYTHKKIETHQQVDEDFDGNIFSHTYNRMVWYYRETPIHSEYIASSSKTKI